MSRPFMLTRAASKVVWVVGRVFWALPGWIKAVLLVGGGVWVGLR